MSGTEATDGRHQRVGELLRRWRLHRGSSQLDLALTADTSARHLSCLETGRALPSREMVLRLSEHLDVPLRERNDLLLAAGYAPEYRETSLDEADMAVARSALDTLLSGHEPYPGVAVDRQWNVVAANRAMSVLLEGVPERLLTHPANVVRLVLDPEGFAARCVNLDELREHFLERLRRQASVTGDGRLHELYEEARKLADQPPYTPMDAQPRAETRQIPNAPSPQSTLGRANPRNTPEVVLPLRFRTPHGELSMFSTIATFGAPADVTLSELAIELFFPFDDHTEQVLRRRAEARPQPEPTPH